MAVMEDHRVRLDAFEGPLDLLLYLIRKNEVDVHDIPVAAITEQYLKFLEELRAIGPGNSRIDIDLAGEFLVMAASLMEIKSRLLAPKPPLDVSTVDPAKPAEDPRAELVRQLLAYKQFRDAADNLERRAEDWHRRFPASPAGVDEEGLREAVESLASEDAEIEDLSLLDLVEAFRKISETVNFDRLGDHEVQYSDTPIELHAEDIVDRLRRFAAGERDPAQPPEPGTEMEFRSLFAGRSRPEMVGLFLALLQLVRQQRVAFRFTPGHEHIYLAIREPDPASPTDPASVPSPVHADPNPPGDS